MNIFQIAEFIYYKLIIFLILFLSSSENPISLRKSKPFLSPT